MSDSKEKYIGESNLSQTPKKKLTLTLADGAVTTKKIADKAITINKFADGVINDVIRPLIDAAKEEINAQIGAGGVAFSDDFGNSNLIGITQKKLTEAYNDVINRITEDKSAAIVSYNDLDSLFVDKSGNAFTADSPIQYGVTFGQEGAEKISGLLTILVSSDGKVVTQVFDTCLLLDGTAFTNASVYDAEVHRYYRHYGVSDNNIVETGSWTSWKDGLEELAEKLRVLQNTPVRYFDGYLEERVVYEAGIAYSGTGGKIYYIAPDNMFVIKPDANNRYYLRWTESGDRLSSEEYNYYDASINKYYIRTDRKFFLVDDASTNPLIVHVTNITDDNSGHYQGTADSTFSEVNEAFKAGRPIIISEDVVLKGQYNVAYISESTLYPNTGYLGLCSTDTGIYILSLEGSLFVMDQDIPLKRGVDMAIDEVQMRMEAAISGAADTLNISIDLLKQKLIFLAFNQLTTPTNDQVQAAASSTHDYLYWYNESSIYRASILGDISGTIDWEECSYLLFEGALFVDLSNKKLCLYKEGELVDISGSEEIDIETIEGIIDTKVSNINSNITNIQTDVSKLNTELENARIVLQTHSRNITNIESVNRTQNSSIDNLSNSIVNIEDNCNAYTDQAIEDLRNSGTFDGDATMRNSEYDFAVQDEENNVILSVYGGHISTKNFDSRNTKKQIKILSFGNSFSCDAFSYVPTLLEQMGFDVTFGILNTSGCTIQEHYEKFASSDAEDKIYDYIHIYTTSTGRWATNTIEATAANALNYANWDIITLQQASDYANDSTTIMPYLNNIINYISASEGLRSGVKFGWLLTPVKPTVEDQDQYIEDQLAAIEEIMSNTIMEFVIPCGIAIANARTIADFEDMGRTGSLTYDNIHLQEGLPCLIEAYVAAATFASMAGYGYKGIMGHKFRPTDEWLAEINIPSRQGDVIVRDVTTLHYIMGQKCAVMALKNPNEVTEITE